MENSAAAQEFIDFVREYVEPLVARAGFEWNSAQSTPDGGEHVLLYEAAPSAFQERYEHLMPDYGEEKPLCIDLWIRWRPSDAGVAATLEATDVDRWLREQGYDSLANTFGGGDLGAAVRALGEGLARMLAG